MMARRLPAEGVVTNLVEYPAVAKGNARFRLQAMPNHTQEHIDGAIRGLQAAFAAVQPEYQRYRQMVEAGKGRPALRAVGA
jgi:glycine C-acetyltransferase